MLHDLGPNETSEALARFQDMVRRIVGRRHHHVSLVAEIACTVGAEILGGVRAPGSDLNSVELARSFKASRTPAREAIAILEKEGLVEVPPRRRPRVTTLSFKEVGELYRVRAAILSLTAAEAAQGGSDEELRDLRRLADEMVRAAQGTDSEHYYWANVRFHERLAQVAHNATLERIHDTLVLRSLRLKRLALASQERIKRSVAAHIQLCAALEDRDPELAAAMAKAILLGALKTVADSLEAAEPPS